MTTSTVFEYDVPMTTQPDTDLASEANASTTARIVRPIAVPVLGLFWLAVTTMPFLFMVMTTFKTQQESYASSM